MKSPAKISHIARCILDHAHPQTVIQLSNPGSNENAPGSIAAHAVGRIEGTHSPSDAHTHPAKRSEASVEMRPGSWRARVGGRHSVAGRRIQSQAPPRHRRGPNRTRLKVKYAKDSSSPPGQDFAVLTLRDGESLPPEGSEVNSTRSCLRALLLPTEFATFRNRPFASRGSELSEKCSLETSGSDRSHGDRRAENHPVNFQGLASVPLGRSAPT